MKKILQNLFKNFFYKIFFLLYGKINSITEIDDDRIKKKIIKIDNINYDLYSILRGRIYTDAVHDAAFIIEDKIIKGPSFQLRDHKNVNPLENIVFKKGTPKIKKKIKGTLASLLSSGSANYNYWHWILDVLPRFKIFENCLKDIDFFLLPNFETNFQKETIRLLNISNNQVLSSKYYRHVYSDKIYTTSHPYNLSNNPYNDHLDIPIWITNYLRKKFLPHKNKKNFPKKFYIDRSDSTADYKFSRIILNENEVKDYLKKIGYEILTLANLSFSDQITLFNNAKSIIGLHGAGFANTAFCEKNTHVLEFKSNSTGNIIKNFTIKNNLNYKDLTCKPDSVIANNQSGNIKIDIKLLSNLVIKN